MNNLIELRGVRTWFPIRRGIFSRVAGHVKAVDGVDLAIAPGESVGLVGESGCGKSTLGRTLVGLETPNDGDILYAGRDTARLDATTRKQFRRDVQIVFQDPFASLNPRLTIMDILTEGLLAHRMLNGAPEDAARLLMEEVGLDPGMIFRYPHEFSGGQRQRISIARALSLKPRLMICDEAVSALDVSVQAQIINLLMDLRDRRGLAYLFISHDLGVVKHLCTRVEVMYLGQIVESGPAREIFERPMHPYTQALVSAVPVPGQPRRDRMVLSGDVPSAAHPPAGCRFHTRCPKVMPHCSKSVPELKPSQDRKVGCFLYS